MAAEFDAPGIGNALVILGAAGVVIPLFARFRISPIIGFILVGALVGPFGLSVLVPQWPWLAPFTIDDPEAIAPFAEFGIILMLFSIGLELSFKRLWSMRRVVFGVGAAELTGNAALIAVALIFIAGEAVAASFGLGVALALSSTALVLPMVNIHGPVGRSALGMLLFEDIALVPIVFALGALSPVGGDGGAALMTVLWQGALVCIVLAVVGRFALPRLFRLAARANSPELFLSASLLVVIGAALATSAVGLSPIVGALLAGLLIAETDYHAEVESTLAPFRGLALGVFMITVGMSIDPAFILSQWQLIAAAVVGVVAIKAVVTALLLRISGASWAVAAETGLLMGSPSETTLIVLGAALTARIIDTETASFWQTVTAIGLTITPLLAKLGRRLAHRVSARALSEAEDDSAVVDDRLTLIIGFGRVGRVVADMLNRRGLPYKATEANPDTVAEAREAGYHVRFGDAARPAVLASLPVDRLSAVVLTMNDRGQQLRLTQALRKMRPDMVIITRARDLDHAAALYRAGATEAIPETLEGSLQLSEALLVEIGEPMGPVIASIHEQRAEMRRQIMADGELATEPRLPRLRNRTT